jgi:hypothetical protein
MELIWLIFNLFCTVFMVFLFWLSKGSKDPFAKKLRVFGYIGTVFSWSLFFSLLVFRVVA